MSKNRFVSDHNPTFSLSMIKEMEIAASKIPGAISLAQGIPSFLTAKEIKDFVHQKIDEGVCDKYSFPSGLTELREEISLSLAKDGAVYDPDNEILITVGSIEGIAASLLAFTEPGDEVLLPSPTYSSYWSVISMARCTAKPFELDEENGFNFDIESIERAITKKTKVLLYATPNNPTGTLFAEEITRQLFKLAEKYDLLVIVDEVYKDFYYVDEPHFSPALIPEARDRLIRVCSFSKAYAMTGWRVGFIATSSRLYTRILKVHDALVNCAPVVSQYAAIAALRFGDSFRDNFVAEYRQRRDYTVRRLDQLSLFLDYQIPKATYFVFPRLKDSVALAKDSYRFSHELLRTNRVAVVPGVSFGPSGESHIRINFGRDQDSLALGLDRLAEYLHGVRTRVNTASDKTTEAKAPSKKERVKPTDQERPSPSSFLRKLGKKLLVLGAQRYINRNKPTIIGIVGTRGKTFFKRTIQEALGRETSVRSSTLSYNTEVGLSLSILKLRLPRSTPEKLLFPFLLFYNAFFSREECSLLVLEYGIGNRTEGAALASIALPEYLVITSNVGSDTPAGNHMTMEGIQEFSQGISKAKIFFPEGDPSETPISGLKQNGNALSLRSFLDDFPNLTPAYIQRGFVGQSAELALDAAYKLSKSLGLTSSGLLEFIRQSCGALPHSRSASNTINSSNAV